MTEDQAIEVQSVKLALTALIAQIFTPDQINMLAGGVAAWCEAQEPDGNVVPLRQQDELLVETMNRAAAIYHQAADMRRIQDEANTQSQHTNNADPSTAGEPETRYDQCYP
jgi:hypothetical protein